MKSDLTQESLKKMYGSTPKKKTKTESNNSVSAKSSREMVVIEADGQKHIVPTHNAFADLLKEHQTMKNELKKAQGEIRMMKEAMNKLIGVSNNLSESLENKVDKPDV